MEISITPDMFGRATGFETKSGTLWVVVDAEVETERVFRDKCAGSAQGTTSV